MHEKTKRPKGRFVFMALKKGKEAPLFKLKNSEGSEFNLEERKGKLTLLYFYPKDFSYGCTKQACSFRDEFAAFRDLNIDVFGINKDSIETHSKFKAKHNLPFELLSDPTGRICKKYDAIIPVLGLVRRVTYLIDEDLKIVDSFENMMRFEKHVEAILKRRAA